MCLMPFAVVKFLNSVLVKHDPLSVTIWCGNPRLGNVICSFSMVTSDVELLVGCTFIHLEWASTIIKNIFPMKWSSIIKVYMKPRLAWPFPRV